MSRKHFEQMMIENGYGYMLKNQNIPVIEEHISQNNTGEYCKCKKKLRLRGDFYCIRCKCRIENNFFYRKQKRDLNYVKIFNDFYGNIDRCQKCNSTLDLQIHHINKNRHDNHPFNLVKICLRCHCNAHKGDRVYSMMRRRLDFLENK